MHMCHSCQYTGALCFSSRPTPASTRACAGLDSRAVDEPCPPLQQHPSWAWWAMRVEVTRQRMLQGRSASLQRLLRSLADRVLDDYAGGRAQPGVQPRSRLAASALLECALAELEYGAMRPAEELLTRANQAAGISISLTGVRPLLLHVLTGLSTLLTRTAWSEAWGLQSHC